MHTSLKSVERYPVVASVQLDMYRRFVAYSGNSAISRVRYENWYRVLGMECSETLQIMRTVNVYRDSECPMSWYSI